VHYFNMLLARELLQTLLLIEGRSDSQAVYGLGPTEAAEIHNFLSDRIEDRSRVLAGTSPLRRSLELTERAMFRSHMRMLRDQTSEEVTPASFIGEMTSLIVGSMPFFDKYRIAFLIDDFSVHRVPPRVQRKLGPIIWAERRSSHIFKVSSEKYGIILDYAGGATADLSRERKEIDCGKEYLDLSESAEIARSRDFAIELLRNRLRVAGWIGTPEQLIGDSPAYREFITGLRHKGQGNRPHYYGLDLIADLCSGDLSTLLMIYHRILVKVPKQSTARVTPNAQHAAVTEVSRELIHSIAAHRPLGREMHQLATEFGQFAANCLRSGKLLSDGKGNHVPIEIPRIEVDQAATAQEELGDDLRDLAQELLRRAVFIELDVGRSRHDYVTTLRWHFRRIYMPAFRAGLHKNDAVKITPSQFKWLLQQPALALRPQWLQRQSDEQESFDDLLDPARSEGDS
jgi:hypothetical protein